MLQASYDYNLKGLVCYVHWIHNTYSYCELSIHVFFMLSQDTPAEFC